MPLLKYSLYDRFLFFTISIEEVGGGQDHILLFVSTLYSSLSIYVMLAVMGKYWLNQLTRFILLLFIGLFTFRYLEHKNVFYRNYNQTFLHPHNCISLVFCHQESNSVLDNFVATY